MNIYIQQINENDDPNSSTYIGGILLPNNNLLSNHPNPQSLIPNIEVIDITDDLIDYFEIETPNQDSFKKIIIIYSIKYGKISKEQFQSILNLLYKKVNRFST